MKKKIQPRWQCNHAANIVISGYNMVGRDQIMYYRGKTGETNWESWSSHQSASNEALFYSTANANTSIIFCNGHKPTENATDLFKSQTEGLRIQNNKVLINKPYSETASGSELQVGGTIEATTLKGNLNWSYIQDKPTIPSLNGYATQSWVQQQGYITKATYVVDYSDNAGHIQIGYAGAGLNTSNCAYLCGYTTSKQIKDVSFDVVKSKLNIAECTWDTIKSILAAHGITLGEGKITCTNGFFEG